jgi:DNA segregation ATPase FtsK/SpoIIIE, S-DNA-T family
LRCFCFLLLYLWDNQDTLAVCPWEPFFEVGNHRVFLMKPFQLALTPTRNRRLNEVTGMVLIVAAILLLLALASYSPTDPSLNTVGGYARVQNWTGLVGASLSDALLQSEGVASFLFPLLLGAMGLTWVRSQPAGSMTAKAGGVLLYLIFAPAMFGLMPGNLRWMHALPVEGVTGRLVGDTLIHYLNFPGAAIVIVSMVVIALYLSTTFSFNTAQQWVAIRFAFVLAWRDRIRNWRSSWMRARATKAALRQEAAKVAELAKAQKAAEKAVRRPKRPIVAEEQASRRGAFAQEGEVETSLPEAQASTLWNQMPRTSIPDPEPEMLENDQHFYDEEEDELPAAPPMITAKSSLPSRPAALPAETRAIAVTGRADADARLVTVAPKAVSGFRLPASTLLTRSDESQIVSEDALRSQARLLVEKCAEFDVRGQVVQINPGPVVTTYEFRPEAGVKYSRVTGLAEDLCLAMSAESILIERMAGKSTVGIQVPNHDRETIWLRDIIEADAFSGMKSKLTLAMGKDINGRIVTADLATMPHVLIAGSTGSGKSVAINAMIMSVLYKATPAQVRMILVDPKRVELGMYEGIPHLFTPIITEPKLAANALRNAVREMERRLKLLASRSVRNIDQYNKLFDHQTPSLFEDPTAEQPLPHIIIIIDELADLMMLDKSNVEEAITRLAQMARAVGIHLVLATQRPSVDVITGLIKANVPTRISFRLATKVDSRTILDSNGAEALLGRGDMLFLPPGTSRLQRLHAPFVTEKEIAAVVGFWKNQGEAEYVQGFLESPRDDKGRDLDAEPEDGDGNDELFEDAVRLVLEFGKASTSLLQRRLRIGYGRAAHLIDMMERDGIVGPADGSKPREILKPPDWINQVEAALR